ncbi:MAG TPA: hypothetical protein VGP47_01510, partial [Parachlamydiaceae bacterium]|nr:hypothetical protein [Parachlamydiaceae bacterium]
LLNRAATGALTPPKVVEEFIRILLKEVRKSIPLEKDAKVVDVLKIYQEIAEELKLYVISPNSIDRWLDLKIETPRLYEENQTKVDYIKGRIGELPLMIHAERHQKKNESHIPAHFYDLLHYQVLNQFNGPELTVVEKAVGVSFVDLKTKVDGFKYTKRTNALLQAHASKIENLVKEIMPLISNENDSQNMPKGSFSNGKACLRPLLYRLRYKMIYADQQAQSAIKCKLESTLNKIKQVARVHFIDDFFYRSFFDKAQSRTMRMMFCKLLNMSGMVLDQKIRELKVNEKAYKAMEGCGSQITQLAGKIEQRIKSNTIDKDRLKTKIQYVLDQIKSSTTVSLKILKNLYYRRLFDHANSVEMENLLTELIGEKSKIDQIISTFQKSTAAEKAIVLQDAKIQELADVAYHEIAGLNSKTAIFQRNLLLELRKAHGMKQQHFVEVYNKADPASSMNKTRISDLENGHVKLTPGIVQKASEIFGISSSLFSPSNFAEAAT